MKKRILSGILCLCMLLSLFCGVPFAQAETFSGNVSADLLWSFDSETGVLTFSGTGTLYGGGQWNMYRGQITSVVIEEGVNAISDGVFGGISTLTSVSFASTVESIGNSVFGGCTGLTSVTIPDTVKSIGSSAFSSCYNMTEITLGENITAIGNSTFAGCTALTTINTKGTITSIGDSAFSGCTALTAAPLTEGVVTIGNSAFNGCTGLTSITIPASVESIGAAAFTGCTDIPAYNVDPDNTNYCCDEFGVLYNIDKTVLIVCPVPFTGSYEVPASVKTIESNAFTGCSGLTGIKLNEGLETIGDYAFQKCSITEVEVPDSVLRIGNHAFAECSSMVSAKLPESVTSMGTHVFYRCGKLEKANVPAGISTLPGQTFYDCASLTEVAIPEGIAIIDSSAFAGCSSLKGITLPESVTTIKGTVFSRCSSLESLHLPKNVSSISSSAFDGCANMTAFTVDAENETLCAEDGVLFNKAKTSLLLYPRGKSGAYEVPAGVTSLGVYAFKECGKVTEITLPEGLLTLGSDCFYRCVLLERVNIPDSVTTLPASAFEYCTALLEVKVGAGITAINRVTFRGCDKLTAITLPAGITLIDQFAFNDCDHLDHILFEGTEEQWNAISVKAYNSGLTDVTVHFEAKGDEIYWAEAEGRQQLHCSLCETVLETPCNHFNVTVIPASEPTCTEAGYTEGKNCADCGEVLLAQESIPALGHSHGAPTDNGNGTHSSTCICGDTITEAHSVVEGSCICGFTEPYLNWSFDSETGTLTFTGNIAIPYSGQWNMYRNQIKSVVIEDGITAISDGALSGISTLTSVSIPSTVKTIGNSAFAGCTALTSATIPDGVESIGDSLFAGCSNLQEAIIGDGVTAVGSQMFSGCFKLTDVTLGESITSIGYSAFGGCAELTNLNIEGNITSIGDSAFGGCSKLTDISLGEGLISIGNSAFGGCTGLTSMRIPASVESIGTYAFGGCTNIPAYEVAPQNTHYCSDEFGVLFNIDKTTLILCPTPFTGSYEVPASVKTIEENAFNGCTGLTAVKLNKGLETIGSYAFQYCGLTEVEVPDGVVNLGSYVFAYNDSLKSAELPDGITIMGTGNFYCCGKLEKANIPAGVTSVRMATFTNCFSLTEVHIAEGVKSFETSAFSGCSSLKNITLPESTTTIGGAVFAGCSALESIHLPKNVSSVATSAFNGCESLTEFTVDGENASYTADDILFNKNMTTLVLYPRGKAGAYEVPTGVTAIGGDAFRECGKLTEITLPEGLLSIGEDGFYKCVLLERVNIPDSVTSMPAYAFEYCTALLEVKVGSGITAINRATFRGCDKLTAITLPAGIATIDQYAFNECDNLDHILFEGTEEQWNAITVGKNNSGLEAATIHFEATGNEVYWDEAEGRQQLHCSLCEIVIETPCNHFNVTVLSATEPTCTEVGLTEGKLCADCGEVLLAQEEIPASGHNYEAEVTVPTCTEDGTVTVACTACGEVLYTGAVPALGHSFAYINEGDSHRIVCKNRCDATDEHGTSCANGCDYAVTEAHSFTDSICVCGAVEVTGPVLDSTLSFGAQLYLENDLTMAFRVKQDKLSAYDISTAYLVVERDVYETGAEEATVEVTTVSNYEIKDGRLVFSYPGIAAAQMNDAIRATLYIKTAEGKEYVSPVLETSVATYLDGLLSAYASDAKMLTLIMDMLNYGAAAQVYFDRHADAPVNEAFESFKTYASYASADFTTALENLSATENAEGKSGKLNLGLDLGTRIGIQYKVTVPADVNVEDVTLVVTDAQGNVLETLVVAGNATDSKGRYIVNFYGSTSRDMRRVVYATAYANGEAITGTYAYSISSYAWGVQENAAIQPADLVNVTRAMMLYGDSAAAYFA